MTFQASDLKRKQFLNLLDNDNNIIKPFYTKGKSWLMLWNTLDLTFYFSFIYFFF